MSDSISNVPAKYAVLGNPIAHSKSPEIHANFAQQTHQALMYDARLITEGQFDLEVRRLLDTEGYQGFNVTLPFKEDAFQLVDELTSFARTAKAVNTIKRLEDGRLIGHNTDGEGLVKDLTQGLKWNLKDQKVLLLGAGGAARGVILPLIEAGISQLHLANRTPAKAIDLVAEFNQASLSLSASGWEVISEVSEQWDIIINATSVSIKGDLPPLEPSIFSEAKVYDMAYAPGLTRFNQWVSDHTKAQALSDGLGMLVEQAALAFEFWRGVMPKTDLVRVKLRQELSAV